MTSPIKWIFVVVNASISLIGMGLLQQHILLINPSKQRLVDGDTKLSVCVTSSFGSRLCSVTARHIIDSHFQRILEKFSGP